MTFVEKIGNLRSDDAEDLVGLYSFRRTIFGPLGSKYAEMANPKIYADARRVLLNHRDACKRMRKALNRY